MWRKSAWTWMPLQASLRFRITAPLLASCFVARNWLFTMPTSLTRVALYVSGSDEQHRRRITLLTELRLALDNDGLQLVYQPKVDMGTRTVKSVEALSAGRIPILA